MKRYFAFLLAACLCFGLLAGCGGNGKGVYYDAIDRTKLNWVSQSNSEVCFEYILLGYNEKVYTSNGSLSTADIEELDLDSILGEELGTAYFGTTHWSDDTEDLYTVDNEGTIYAVQGYDPDFRVCLYYEIALYPDPGRRVVFYDRLNDVTLEKGSDLFTDRLHLTADQTSDAQKAVVESFLTALNEGTFLDPEDEAYPDLESMTGCAITFTDEYGIQTKLTVYEGYVCLNQAGVEDMVLSVDALACTDLMSAIG